MKIAILSDSHDNLPNFKKAVSWIEKEEIKIILHCGDVSTVDTLQETLKNFSGKFYFVLGNMDEAKLNSSLSLPNVQIFDKFGEISLGDKKIAFTHFSKIARELAEKQKYDFVFYGHTHKPWEEKIGKTKLVNPGNLAGLLFKATFAVYDTQTDKLELKILEKLA